MHTVIETHVFRRAADAADVSEDERQGIATMLSGNPMGGAVIPGTGGARKLRYPGRGKGKSGGYRVITFYAASDVPVFLLDLYAKGEKINLTEGEKKDISRVLGTLAEEWRASVRDKVTKLRA